MDKAQAETLLDKYLTGKCTPEEKALLERFYLEQTGKKEIPEVPIDIEHIRTTAWQYIAQRTTPVPVRSLWPRIAAAASILLFLTIGSYFLIHQPTPTVQVAQHDPEQIAPVAAGVTLQIGKGKLIALDAKHRGQIATSITQQDSILHYSGKQQTQAEPELNTITNNSGAKFTIAMADGTEATVDVASTLTYPTAFTGKERLVSMTGQVYFKVKHNQKQTFRVEYADQIAEDIGTEFNIDAYPDAGTPTTTLIEGAVKINRNDHPANGVLLKPGQQAIVTGDQLKAVPADIEAVTAWLQNKLIFEKEPLEKILARVSRIYGVTFVYQDNEVRKLTYGGSVSSTKKLSSVLNFFRRLGGVDFIVEGKTVKVLKQKKK